MKGEISMDYQKLPVSKCHLDPNQPREIYDGIEELASSMREVGFLRDKVISVRPHPTIIGEFMIADGHRRRLAAEKAEIENIPALIFDAETTDEEIYEVQIITNEHRKDLTTMNRVRAIQKGIDQFGWSHEKIAKYYGVSIATIKAELELINLAPDLHKLVDAGEIPKEVARKLATSFPEAGHQMSVFGRIKGKKTAAKMLEMIDAIIEKEKQTNIFAKAKKDAAAGEDNGSERKFQKAFKKLERALKEYEKGGFLGNLNVITAMKRSHAEVEITAKLAKKMGEVILKDLEAYRARSEINAPQKKELNG
jgi:ParB/RepB/Spo0J family partition protein